MIKYCLECENQLAFWDAEIFKLPYCSNRNCERYGIFTAIFSKEQTQIEENT